MSKLKNPSNYKPSVHHNLAKECWGSNQETNKQWVPEVIDILTLEQLIHYYWHEYAEMVLAILDCKEYN